MNLAELVSAIWSIASLHGGEATIAPPGFTVSVWIGVVGGLSTLIGHSAILFINRVRRIRFLAALLVGGLLVALLYAFQALILWVVLAPITGRPASLVDTVTVTLAATAPLAFGFLIFLPHLGILIGHVLQGWTALCLWQLIMALQETTWWQALAAGVLSWLLMQLASRLLGPPVGVVAGRIWTLVTGRPAMLTARDVLAGVPFVPVESEAAR